MSQIFVEINGRRYRFPELDFNAVCDLQDAGIDPLNPKSIARKPIYAGRSILAWVMNDELEVAGNEIQQHILNGGNLTDLFECFTKAMEESGFIKSLTEKAEGEFPDHKRKQRTRKQEETE